MNKSGEKMNNTKFFTRKTFFIVNKKKITESSKRFSLLEYNYKICFFLFFKKIINDFTNAIVHMK